MDVGCAVAVGGKCLIKSRAVQAYTSKYIETKSRAFVRACVRAHILLFFRGTLTERNALGQEGTEYFMSHPGSLSSLRVGPTTILRSAIFSM